MVGALLPDAPSAQHRAYHVGSRVWVPVQQGKDAVASVPVLYGGSRRPVSGWVKGSVTRVREDGRKGDEVLLDIQTEEGRVLSGLSPDSCPLQNERDDAVEDLTASDFLHEPGILHTLQVRYTLDSIYTYSGNILIAVNPHKRLPHLYGSRMMAQYRGLMLGDLSPHVYAIAEQAFTLMMIDKQPQSVLISGESGAGKTETAKLVMQYLAHRGQAEGHVMPGRNRSGRSAVGAQEGTIPIEEQVLESNPLLEAFGNAKTSRNTNSSRFGKFVEIGFDESGRVMGATISTFLLERSRVVAIAAPERSYHIFYQLCAGASDVQRAVLHLEGGAKGFRYLAASPVLTLQDVDDSEAFRHTCDAMRIVGLSDQDQQAVFSIVASVLHLGNIEFVAGPTGEDCTVGNQGTLAIVAELLGVSLEKLSTALLTRTIQTVGETIVKPLHKVAATESRDALAKTLYGALFDWLVAAVNRRIATLGSVALPSHTIGILDIYGFESFADNSFEQLCINLANERLQQQFNQHVFKEEQDEYQREGIDWSYVKFVDNQETLDLLEGLPGQPALGVFPLLDEACRLPKATSADLAHTVRTRLAGKPRFDAPKRSQKSFTVWHYAGQVIYNTDMMLDKNRDYLVAEHQELMTSSSNHFLRTLLLSDANVPASAGRARAAFKLSTIGDRFRKQLQILAKTLNKTNPHYIRCVKPNSESRPGSLDSGYTLEQLRAGGVLEAVRIACAGFPTRKAHAQLLARYGMLLQGLSEDHFMQLRRIESQVHHGEPVDVGAETVKLLVQRLLGQQALEGWQMGVTRVFLRSGQLAQLEGIRGARLAKAAIIVQAAIRMHIVRRAFRRKLAAIVVLQAAHRGRMTRRQVGTLRRHVAATRIQSAYRMHQARMILNAHRQLMCAMKLQSWARMVIVRRRFVRETELGRRSALRARKEHAAIVFQKYARRWLAQRRAAAIRREAARLAELEAATVALRSEAHTVRHERDQLRSEAESHKARNMELEALVELLNIEVDAAKRANKGASQEYVEVQVKAAAEAEAEKRDQMARQMAMQRTDLEASVSALRDAEAGLQRRDDMIRQLQAQMEALQGSIREKDAQLSKASSQLSAMHIRMEETRQAYEDRLQLEQVKYRDDMEAVKTDAHMQSSRARQEFAEQVASMRRETEKSLERERARHKETQKRYYAASATIVQLKKDLAEYQAQEARKADNPAMPARAGLRKARENGVTSKEKAGMSLQQRDAVHVLCSAALRQGLLGRGFVTVDAKGVMAGSEILSFPVASWWVGRALLQWRVSWSGAAFDGAAHQVLKELHEVSLKEKGSLRSQASLLAASLALSGLLATASSGTDMRLAQYSSKLLNLTDLHTTLCEAMCQIISFTPRLMGTTAMRRRARHQQSTIGLSPESSNGLSPPPGANPWDDLKDSLNTVLSTLRDDAGLPPPAVQAVLLAAMSYLNAELMNDLMTRRQSCSTSALKVLHLGLSEIRDWAASVQDWSGGSVAAECSMQHTTQSVRYMLSAKEDIIRKHVKGMDVMQDLARVCPSLTLQQVQRLTQCHHDDWVGHDSGPSGAGLDLLRALQHRADQEPLGQTIQQVTSPAKVLSAKQQQVPIPSDDGDALLLDLRAALRFSPALLRTAAKVYTEPAVSGGARARIMGLPLPADMEACTELSFLCA